MVSKPQKPPTIKEVAAEAGLSFSTAGAALRGDRHVRASTRQTVLEAAAKLGYQPNRAAAHLAGGTASRRRNKNTISIALVEFSKKITTFEGPQSIFVHAQQRGKQLGYDVAHIDLNQVDDQAAFGNHLYHRGYQGLLIGRVYPHRVDELQLPWDRFSVVCLNRYDHSLAFHCVRIDHVEAIRMAFDRLVKSGCRRIGAALYHHRPGLLDDDDRDAAFMQRQTDQLAKRHHVPLFSKSSQVRRDDFYAWWRKWQPDGLIGFTSRESFLLRDIGFEAPRDYHFVSLGEPADASGTWPISGVIQPHRRIGEIGLELLDRELKAGHRGMPESSYDVVVPPDWLQRSSDGGSAPSVVSALCPQFSMASLRDAMP